MTVGSPARRGNDEYPREYHWPKNARGCEAKPDRLASDNIFEPEDGTLSDDDLTPGFPPPPKVPVGPWGQPERPIGPDLPIQLTHIPGGFGQLWVAYVTTVVLSLLTLTVYRFWGMTRIRRQLWSRVVLLDDPFEYTGSGWELFIGFLKVMFYIVLPVTLIIAGLNFALQSMGLFTLEQIIGFITAVGFYWIVEVAIFLRFRYRANRTSWRGIRARVNGNATDFAGRALLLAAGVAFTGGILYPYAHAFLMRYKLNCLSFGGLKVRSSLSSRNLYGRFFLCSLLSMVLGLILLFSFVISTFTGAISGTSVFTPGTAVGIDFITGLLLAPFALAPFAWYWAKFYRAAAQSVLIGEDQIDVAYDVTGWQLLRYAAGNWALIVFSLGLLWPLTWIRKIELICNCFRINREISVEALLQEAYDPTNVGEELGGGFEIV